MFRSGIWCVPLEQNSLMSSKVAQSFCWLMDVTPSISGLILIFYLAIGYCGSVYIRFTLESGTKEHPPEKVLVYN